MEGMAGNVFEWCEDVDDPGFYLHGPDRNPRNTIQLGEAPCVIRGGSWRYDARSLRTYARASFPPTFRLDIVGFRVAL
jgi:serine/threonine-protein kinase